VTGYVARHAPAAAIVLAADALYRAAQRIDEWLAARAQSAADSAALAAMSEGELRDIGLHPARIHGGAHGCLRDLVP
jgi:uncharacterized protein YjiS (DUF1127 family)